MSDPAKRLQELYFSWVTRTESDDQENAICQRARPVCEEQDWRGDWKSVSETLSKARHSTLFVDVRFLVGEGSNARYFSAHKLILACGSPVFEAMFFGQLAEKKDPISMPDDDPQGFEFMLRFLYGERICFPSIVVACKAYSVADKYLIPQLQKMSSNFIAFANMDDASFWGIIEGNLLDCKNAEEKFKKYIQVHAARLLKSHEFLEVPEDIVKMILQMDPIDITEYELLCFATKWGSKRYTNDTACKLQTLLQNIRFSTLTPQEFCRFHTSFPDVLDTVKCLKILKHLNDPDACNLPYWCSKNKTKRNMTNEMPMPMFSFTGPSNNSVFMPEDLSINHETTNMQDYLVL